MIWRILIAWYLTVPILSSGYSQQLTLLKEIQITEPVSASVDRRGNLFVAERSGVINKYSQNGDVELNYASSRNTRPTLLEAWTSLDILLFFEATQSVTILNRFLTLKSEYSLSDRIGFARLATFNFESNLWVIDDSDFTLKMLDLTINRVTISVSLNQILNPDDYQFSFIREYQNLLFVADVHTGVLVLDNLGNYLRTIPVKDIQHFGFRNNEIYFQSPEGLIFIDIYTGDQRKMDVPNAKFTLITSKRIYQADTGSLRVYVYEN